MHELRLANGADSTCLSLGADGLGARAGANGTLALPPRVRVRRR